MKKEQDNLSENKDEKKQSGEVSRRDFLTRAGILVAGGAVGSGLLSGCAGEITTTEKVSVTQTKTTTMPTTVEIEKTITTNNDTAKAIGRIIHNQDICSGCRTCEIVCSTYHEGISSPSLSRLQIKKYELGGYITDVMACKQCDGPECLWACPTGALHVDSNTGARVIDSEVCVGCQLCINACTVVPPRVRFNPEKNISFKCNLCDGDPQCVKFCPTGALTASWIKADVEEEEEKSIIEEVISGEASIWTHLRALTLSESEAGFIINGTLWTSHCSRSTVVYGIFNICADFYDATGSLLGTSETVTIQLAEMLSSTFALNFNSTVELEDIAKVIVTVNGTEVYAGQEES